MCYDLYNSNANASKLRPLITGSFIGGPRSDATEDPSIHPSLLRCPASPAVKFFPFLVLVPGSGSNINSILLIMATVDAILAAKYPGKAHARRVAQALKTQDAGAIYLEAQKTRLIEDNDEAQPFR